MTRHGWLISICAGLLAAPPVMGARFGEFAMRSTLSPDTAASASGQTMVMLAGTNNMDLFGAAPGVRTQVGTVCLMSEPFDPASESVTVRYTISLTLIDQLSGESATLGLTPPAGLTADVTIPTRGNAISHTVTDLPATVSARIGSAEYTVSALPGDYFTEPGPPNDKGAGDVGGFSLWITATPVPEPATCLSLPGAFASIAIRRRR
jgi:hypothetical protein